MTLAALEATLRIYLCETKARQEIPTLRMLALPLAELKSRAEALAHDVGMLPGIFQRRANEDVAYVGGGSLPDQTLTTWVVEVQAQTLSDTEFAQRLRLGTLAVVGRLREGKVVLDMRTVFPDQDAELRNAVAAALSGTLV